MYNVIKYVQAIKNTKDDGIIFKDASGKIYFLDKRYNKGIEKINLDDKVLVWVQKEMDKVGYVALEINGLSIKSYIEKFSELTLSDILNMESKVIAKLSNDLYNHDKDFRMKLSEDNSITLLPFAKEVINFYNENGINSKVSEFRYELVIALCYLYDKFYLSEKILESHDLIAKIRKCYPPNIIEISSDGLFTNYYHGLEEGLMCWDNIFTSELKEEIIKRETR